jgi:acetylornithine deacetylase
MYGRGTSDSKGNLVMGLMAVKALLESGGHANGRILFESVVDEECSGGGAGTLACCLAGITGDFAIVMDGQCGRVVTGCNGVLTVRLTVKGRAGHSAHPGSVNAIDKGIQAKQAFDVFAREHVRSYPQCHAVVSMFRAGTLPSVVPGEAELVAHMSYECTAARAAEEQQGHWGGALIRQRVESALRELAPADSWFSGQPVGINWVNDLNPFFTDERNAYVQAAVTSARQVSGPGVEVGVMRAWCDAAWLSRKLRIPVIGLGHGTPGTAHGAEEHVVLDDLHRGAKTVALTLHRILSVPQ